MGICQGPDCDRETDRRYCDGHWKQLQRGRPLTPIEAPKTPLEAVILAGNDLAEAEEEDDYRRAKERLLSASQAWLRSQGWRPPVVPKASPCCCSVVQLALPLRFRRPRSVHARAYAGT